MMVLMNAMVSFLPLLLGAPLVAEAFTGAPVAKSPQFTAIQRRYGKVDFPPRCVGYTSARSTSMNSATFTYDDDWHASLLHPLDDLGVDLDDDVGIVAYYSGNTQTAERPAEDEIREVAMAFAPVALLILIEIMLDSLNLFTSINDIHH